MSSLLDLPPPPASHPSRSSQSTKLSFLCWERLPTSFLFYPWPRIDVSAALPVHPTLPFPRPVSTCPFCTSASLFLHSKWVHLYVSLDSTYMRLIYGFSGMQRS